jgi:hypothetical protein
MSYCDKGTTNTHTVSLSLSLSPQIHRTNKNTKHALFCNLVIETCLLERKVGLCLATLVVDNKFVGGDAFCRLVR